MAGQCKTTGAGNARTKRQLTKKLSAFLKKRSQSFLNVCVVSLIVCKQDMIIFIDDCDLYGCGTNVDSKSENQIHTIGVISPYLLCGVIQEKGSCIINM